MTEPSRPARDAAADDAPDAASVRARADDVLGRALAEPLAPGLHVVATPIGNLGDITLRALAVLARADAILAEDTRHSRKLLSHFGIVGAKLLPFHDHNEDRERPRALARLRAGEALALISDAGTPLVSDPGHKLVRAAREAGLPVFGVPGASAVLAALTGAGLASDRFYFEGFLPPRQAARRARLEALAAVPATLVVYEAPGRIAATLAAMAETLGPREAAVARELTKLHEEVTRGALPELAAAFAARQVKGEAVILVAPPGPAAEADDETVRRALAEALRTRSLRDAAREVADDLGVARSRAYRIGLALQDGPR